MAEPTAPTPLTRDPNTPTTTPISAPTPRKYSLCETCQEPIGDFTTRIEPEHTTPQHCIKALARRIAAKVDRPRVSVFEGIPISDHRVIGKPEDGGIRG